MWENRVVPHAVDGVRSLELANEAQLRFDVDAVVAHLSAAVRAFTADESPHRAAMACVRLGDALSNLQGNLTAGRAWFARAERLVEPLEPCIEQGWVAVAGMGCDAGDPAELLARAELALDRARRFGDLNLETKALADAGLAHVQAGRVDQGFAMLDEAMALACGPVDDGDTAAKSACSMFTACYYTASYERAGTWATSLRRNGLIGPAPGGPVFLSDHCASVEAAALLELGRWTEAEQLLLAAGAQFERATGEPGYHSSLVLADLRILQGRLADAEVLLAGRGQVYEGLIPSARLALAGDDPTLARAIVGRGLRTIGDDRNRAVELLEVAIAAEVAAGDLEQATVTMAELRSRCDVDHDADRRAARVAGSAARVMAALGDHEAAIRELETATDRIDVRCTPWRWALLVLDLARAREAVGDLAGAAADARAADQLLAGLDVVLAPEDAGLVAGLTGLTGLTGGGRGDVAAIARQPASSASSTAPSSASSASLVRTGRTWLACHHGNRVQLRDSKGLRYLAELIAAPGVERHALDLVDRVEGVDGAVDRRTLGDAGPMLDGAARRAYRHRIEALRNEIEESFELGRDDTAETLQDELDRLVGELAAAFGVGGRSRRAASAVERARLNVTRSVRTAIVRITEALPEAGAALDRGVRTGTYCSYGPADNGVVWIVQSELNGAVTN